MRVMVLVKADEKSEAGEMPSEQLIADMTAYNEALVNAGIMVDGDGLKPSSAGVRVYFSGDKRSVTDGPFAETKELLAGYWVWQVESMDEAVEWAKKCPNPTGEESVLELRPFVEAADFGEAFTPELQEREEALRQRSQPQS